MSFPQAGHEIGAANGTWANGSSQPGGSDLGTASRDCGRRPRNQCIGRLPMHCEPLVLENARARDAEDLGGPGGDLHRKQVMLDARSSRLAELA